LDALMKPMRFDVFEYIVDEISNITTNLLKSCGFAPYIEHMIYVVTKEKFYKDLELEPLHPIVPKDLRTHHASSLSYPIFMPKQSTHRMHDPGSIAPHILPTVFTDIQMSHV
jgi:hypothetical protein